MQVKDLPQGFSCEPMGSQIFPWIARTPSTTFSHEWNFSSYLVRGVFLWGIVCLEGRTGL